LKEGDDFSSVILQGPDFLCAMSRATIASGHGFRMLAIDDAGGFLDAWGSMAAEFGWTSGYGAALHNWYGQYNVTCPGFYQVGQSGERNSVQ
jgi:hypothetical protein